MRTSNDYNAVLNMSVLLLSKLDLTSGFGSGNTCLVKGALSLGYKLNILLLLETKLPSELFSS